MDNKIDLIYTKAIKAVLHQVHNKLQINKESIYVIKKLLLDLISKFTNEILNSNPVSSSISTHINKIMSGELARHALSEVNKYKYHSKKKLVFPKILIPSIAENLPEAYAFNISVITEYIAAEILELSGSECNNKKRIIIQPCDICHAITADEELNSLFMDIFIVL